MLNSENYLFDCSCPKCVGQIGHSDEEEEEEWEDVEEEEN